MSKFQWLLLSLVIGMTLLLTGCPDSYGTNITEKDYAYVINADGSGKQEIKWFGGYLKMSYAIFNRTGDRVFIQYSGETNRCGVMVDLQGNVIDWIVEDMLYIQPPARLGEAGDKLLVTSYIDRKLYTLDLGSYDMDQIIPDQTDGAEQYYPSSTNDGRKVVYYAVNSDSTSFLRVFNMEDQTVTNLLSNTQSEKYYYPIFSPDEEWIYFFMTGANPGLFKIRPDGSDWSQIIYYYADQPGIYTPDGNWVIFSNYGRIMKMNLVTEEFVDLGYGFKPSLSPDGNTIVYTDSGNIRIMDIDGDNVQLLAEGDRAWFSPVADKIVYIDYRND